MGSNLHRTPRTSRHFPPPAFVMTVMYIQHLFVLSPRSLAMSILIVLASGATVFAEPINLMWDASASQVSGYMVHVGTQSQSYSQRYDVGTSTSFTYPDAVPGQRYCFAVSAYGSTGDSPLSSEVCGYSDAPPTLTNPGNQSSVVGTSTSLQLSGSDPYGQPVSYSASGLPPGLSLASSTGFISGTGTTAGTYSVSARAYDGRLYSSTQSFTWTMTAPATPPTISIVGPTSTSSYATTSSSVSLSGTAAASAGLSQVSWVSDRGASGLASGTTSWSTAPIPLQSGTNVLTVRARDTNGNEATDQLTVTYSVYSAPTISIAGPTSASTYTTTNASVSLTGTAAASAGLSQVSWASDRGGSGLAAGTTNWSTAQIPLQGGTNVLTVRARDTAGNEATDVLTVTYSAPQPSVVTLSASTHIYRGKKNIALSWTSCAWRLVDVYRNGLPLTRTENDGSYLDVVKKGGAYTYRLCETGNSANCSTSVTVYF